ncbi:MAG: major capsid protein [Polaromonas sp.]|nr:major capsid protein [Polaromonas sp.]
MKAEKMFKKFAASKTLAVLVVSAAASVSAQAAAIDVAALTTDIAAQAAPVAAVGGAILLIFLGIKAFKWVRAAMG